MYFFISGGTALLLRMLIFGFGFSFCFLSGYTSGCLLISALRKFSFDLFTYTLRPAVLSAFYASYCFQEFLFSVPGISDFCASCTDPISSYPPFFSLSRLDLPSGSGTCFFWLSY
jgi:hypothetical protein